MIDKRPETDRILIAEIWGEARRAQWRQLAEDGEAAAVAALRELAGERADLLAEAAGILEGTSEEELDEPLAQQAAQGRRRRVRDPGMDPGRQAAGSRSQDAAVLRRTAIGAKLPLDVLRLF